MSPKKKKEETKPKPIDLKLTLENFGPLRKAEVDLKPMTIFIGPNNSGKSYVATMIYSLFRSYWHVDPGPPIWPPVASEEGVSKELNTRAFLEDRFCYETLSAILSRNPDLPDDGPLGVSPIEADEISSSIFQKISLGPLSSEIARIYGAGIARLRRNEEGSLLIGIEVPNWSVKLKSDEGNLSIEHLNWLFSGIKGKKYDIIYWEAIDGKPDGQSKEARVALLGHALATESLRPLWLQLERGIHYLPGERAGLILLGSPFIASILQQKALWQNWRRTMNLPRGADSDFLKLMAELVGLNPGPLWSVAEELEKEIIAGSIQLTPVHKSLPPKITYLTRKCELLLHQCSSTISELAPLILHVKYLAQPGSLLIIDEPEAHLHPENQSILAKYLARLVRAGVNLIITTHSEYLLSRLSNFVMLEGIKKERRKELGAAFGFGEDDYLAKEEVGVYRFKYDRRSKAYVTKREKATREGIRQGEFGEVDEELYEEEIRIENELSE